MGYQVPSTASSIEALHLFQQGPDGFDLVITDMTMPKMNGDELSRKLLEIRPDIPIILCSGFSELINHGKATDIGTRDFILKPVTTMNLTTAIRNVLDSSNDTGAS